MSGTPVAVIGGGYAGCAAAVTLADAGLPVVLYEAAPTLGGRARRVVVDGVPIDNGQHLLLGAYRETLALMRRVHGDGALPIIRRPLSIVPFGDDTRDAMSLVARRAPGRLGLAIGLLGARGLSWRDRLANVRWMRRLERTRYARPAGETVAAMLAPLPTRVTQALWTPLCLAALNTPIETASAQVFANVLRAAFGLAGTDSDFVIPATDLSALLPEAAERHVAARGGHVHVRSTARVVAAARGRVVLDIEGDAMTARAAVLAVGPHQLTHAFDAALRATLPALGQAIESVEQLTYEPIVTIWLGYPSRATLPAPIARLDDAPGQWVLDRPDVLGRTPAESRTRIAQVLAVIVSASGPHMAMPHDALARAADAQLRRLLPALPPCTWSQVIAEKRATYACTPTRARPDEAALGGGLYLAGDYIDDLYPATLEAAVRSGLAAGRAVIRDLASDKVPH